MAGNEKRGRTEIEILADHRRLSGPLPMQSVLIRIRQGQGRLHTLQFYDEKADPREGIYYNMLLLNGKPLYRMQCSGCPTCESLLAAGDSLSDLERDSLSVRSALDRPFAGMREASERLHPILEMLESGIYILTSMPAYPTDGEGHFFWNGSSALTPCPATAMIYNSDNYRLYPSAPCFLYPSQSPEAYDEVRVCHYRKQLRQTQALPPILTYTLSEYISVLLDGHHRASAGALEGQPIPSLNISRAAWLWRDGVPRLIWPDGIETPLPDSLSPSALEEVRTSTKIQTLTGSEFRLPKMKERLSLPGDFNQAVIQFPTCREISVQLLYPNTKLTPEGIRELAVGDETEELSEAIILLEYAARQPGADRKVLGRAFLEKGYPEALRTAAYRILNSIQEDAEIDELMIQALVDIEDHEDPIYQLAAHHWD